MKQKIQFFWCSQALEVDASQRTTLLAALLKNKVELDHSCGGMGSCGTCRVLIENAEDFLCPRTGLEAEIAADRDFSSAERLACQVIVKPGLRVKK